MRERKEREEREESEPFKINSQSSSFGSNDFASLGGASERFREREGEVFSPCECERGEEEKLEGERGEDGKKGEERRQKRRDGGRKARTSALLSF